MSQTPPNWPEKQQGGNPFSDQAPSPFVPGTQPLPPGGYYGPPPTRIEDEPGMRWILPVGQSGWSIAAGYLGLFATLCIPAPLALLCGIVAIWHLRKNPRLSGWGRAIFGTVMGAIGTIFLLFGLVAAAIGAK
jgi:hypothetical protein